MTYSSRQIEANVSTDNDPWYGVIVESSIDIMVCDECGAIVADQASHDRWHWANTPRELMLRMNGWK